MKAGLALGAVTAAWTLVMGVTGWYKHPSRPGRGYGAQGSAPAW